MANRTRTATVDDLPPELFVKCLLPLSFTERLWESQVSRRWRAVSKDYPWLWNKVKFAHSIHHRDMFLSVLARSRNALLDASWAPNWYSKQGLDLLEANMGRVRALDFRTNDLSRTGVQLPASLLNSPVHRLEELSAHADNDVIIPPEWSGDGAPRLREITVDRFTFDSGCRPFKALHRFCGRTQPIRSARIDPRSILRLCPALEDLELRKADHVDVHCLAQGPIPATLTSLSFTSAVKAIDYQAFLTAVQDKISRIVLSNTKDVVVPLQHFATHTRGDFRMTCNIARADCNSPHESGALEIQLVCAGPRSLKYDTPGIDAALDRTPHLVLHMGALTRLELPTEMFDRLLRANAVLPELEALTVVVCGARPFGDLNYCHFARRGCLHVPRLRALTIDTTHAVFASGAANWYFSTLPATIRTWLRFEDGKLGEVYLFLSRQVVHPDAAMHPEVLRSCADKVFIGWKGDWELGLFQEGGWCI